MELSGKSGGAGGSIDGSTSEYIVELRLGVRAVCGGDPKIVIDSSGSALMS